MGRELQVDLEKGDFNERKGREIDTYCNVQESFNRLQIAIATGEGVVVVEVANVGSKLAYPSVIRVLLFRGSGTISPSGGSQRNLSCFERRRWRRLGRHEKGDVVENSGLRLYIQKITLS